jgi:hypothetical protein
LELGEWYVEHDEWKTALAHFDAAHQATEHAESRDRQGQALFGKARVMWALGDQEAARQFAEQSLKILQQTHSRYARAVERWLGAHLSLEEGPMNEAAPADDLE